MKTRMFVSFLWVICFVLATAFVANAGEAKKPDRWFSGVGYSALTDPLAAGDAAAKAAKDGLNGEAPAFVMVTAAAPMLTPELLEGVEKHFPAVVIYGGEVTSPWTPEGNAPEAEAVDVPFGVGVWALGGDVDVDVRKEVTDNGIEQIDPYYAAGLRLGKQMRGIIARSKRPGKLLITWGDQYTGSNKSYVRGLNTGLGETWTIAGGASGSADAKIIYAGQIYTGLNICVLLGGEFTLGQAWEGGAHTPQSTQKALENAISQGDGKEPFFALMFNCRRRRLGLMNGDGLRNEQAVVQKLLAGEQFYGFYGPGEVGADKIGVPAQGMGFTVVATVFFAK